jgi:hypothetical protein
MKPIDPSPTPWDFGTWGFYCDVCEKFFDLVRDGRVATHEKNLCSYWHKPCGQPARYIGYDHSRQLRPDQPCSHRGCLSHVTHPCEGCGRIAGQYPEDKEKCTCAELRKQGDYRACPACQKNYKPSCLCGGIGCATCCGPS